MVAVLNTQWIMFIAKYTQVSADSDVFEADKNGNLPYIGENLAGVCTGSIINGTMFEREGLVAGANYACENYIEEYEGVKQVRVQIIDRVTILDFVPLRKALGAPVNKIVKKADAVAVAEAVEENAEVAFEA